jgi:trehalose-6-phosphatase
MFTVVATIFQQIVPEFNGAELEEDRIMIARVQRR